VDNFSDWQAILASYLPRGINYERIGFNDPLYIQHHQLNLDKNERIVHQVGGTILNHLKEHQLQCNIQPANRILSHCSCSSSSFIWHISALASGATLVFYDGAPFSPGLNAIWSLAEESQAEILHVNVHYLNQLQANAFAPSQFYTLDNLKTLIVSGLIKDVHIFEFVYTHILADICVVHASQEPDMGNSFFIGNTMTPIDAQYLPFVALGCDAEYIDNNGQIQLRCHNSFPHQPLGFWNDSGVSYYQTYWQQTPGSWCRTEPVKSGE
jgi:acetoacetyl-CoA synthetase